ncbi:winged helix-turn-helix transcriptional regulator [Candidatus Woesearchaeota archaeon]|nr:winged helix-turn-helix transcriptional regulator [Candidatus Woesearchaeota archaeon]
MVQDCVWNSFYKLIGKKYTLVLIELVNEKNRSYNELLLYSKRMINPTLLASRLKELTHIGLLTKNTAGKYKITSKGKKVCEQLTVLNSILLSDLHSPYPVCMYNKMKCFCDILHR